MLYYKSGIYDPTTDEIVGAHAVRLIGWGEDADASGVNRPYWLVANSWNTVRISELTELIKLAFSRPKMNFKLIFKGLG